MKNAKRDSRFAFYFILHDQSQFTLDFLY